MAINSIDLNKLNLRIQGNFEDQEINAKSLCKQIFWKYGYYTIESLNKDDILFAEGYETLLKGKDRGIDDVISRSHILKYDPLKLKQLKRGRKGCIWYNIDYTSNNFSIDQDAVYVKLGKYNGLKPYKRFFMDSGMDTMCHYMKLDRENKRRNNRMEKYYGNKQLLSNNNLTDYFFYVRYTPDYFLEEAYLVPAEKLRLQVIDILNNVLKSGEYERLKEIKQPIELRKDNLFLNHKITKALKIWQTNEPRVKPGEIELFKVRDNVPKSKPNIILKIPEHELIDYIKFNEDGDIIN